MPMYEYEKDDKVHRFVGTVSPDWAYDAAEKAFGKGGFLRQNGVVVIPRTVEIRHPDEMPDK